MKLTRCCRLNETLTSFRSKAHFLILKESKEVNKVNILSHFFSFFPPDSSAVNLLIKGLRQKSRSLFPFSEKGCVISVDEGFSCTLKPDTIPYMFSTITAVDLCLENISSLEGVLNHCDINVVRWCSMSGCFPGN